MMKGASACPLRAIKMEAPIPITIPVTYNTYAWLYSQGLLASYLCETPCPKYPHDCCSQRPPPALELTNSSVDRTAFMLEKDDYDIDTVVKATVKIVLVRCPICKSRYRQQARCKFYCHRNSLAASRTLPTAGLCAEPEHLQALLCGRDAQVSGLLN